MTENVDGILRPKRNAAGEIADVGNMKREIAEVVRRLHFELVAIDEDEPAENAESEEGETSGEQPKPNARAARRGGIFVHARFPGGEKCPHGHDRAEQNGNERKAAPETALEHAEYDRGNYGDVNESESAREPLHGLGAGPCPTKSGARSLKKFLNTFALR